MASQEEAGGSRPRKEPIEDLLKRLELQEDEEEHFVSEEELHENQVATKWLAIAKVHTDKGFSPSALYADMRSAWNPAKEPRWRRIEDNMFTVQFGCRGDWNTAMNMGPWLFRDHGLLIAEYDGFTNPTSVVLDKIVVWARILKLPDNYLIPATIRGMCRKMGKILEIQTTLPAGFAGEFVRVRVELDFTKKLIRFVGITKKEVTDYYQVQYEKLPIFCGHCGMMGHWYQKCGTGEHDVAKLEWGDFLLADGGRGRGTGRNPGRGRGGSGSNGNAFGRGRGRGEPPFCPW